jgi:hypothetical protein
VRLIVVGTCRHEANIRVDLLLIWPLLGLLTLWAFLKLGISVFIRKETHE